MTSSMNNLDKLVAYFEKFPGIGARQARRFAFHVLTLPPAEIEELARLITSLPETVKECERCHRFFATSQSGMLCGICSDYNRDHTKLMIVERDNDILPIERSGVYDGLYFVLGGTVPLLENKENNKLRGAALKSTVTHTLSEDLTEITLAFVVNPDGDNTARYVELLLKEILTDTKVTITRLGRGLSTGSELEYADADTIKNAFINRG